MKTIDSVEEAISIVCHPEEFLSSIWDKGLIGPPSQIQYPFPFGLWFRGQCRGDYRLIPSVFRRPQLDHVIEPDEPAWYDEDMMIQHIRQRNPSYEEGYKNPFDLLCLLQHYDFPTRLLDWTESVLIALYFAVKKDGMPDGKLFALNARRLNAQTRLHDQLEGYICGLQSIDTSVRSLMAGSRRLKDLRFAFQKIKSLDAIEKINLSHSPNYINTGIHLFHLWLEGSLEKEGKRLDSLMTLLASPVAVFPNRLNPRMTSQLSMILLFGGKKGCPNEYLECEAGECLPFFDENKHGLEELNRSANVKFLEEFVIPSGKKAYIREQLRCIGMHEAALYPELDHVGSFVRKEWTFPKAKLLLKSVPMR